MAMYVLSGLYYRGHGVDQSDADAQRWFELAEIAQGKGFERGSQFLMDFGILPHIELNQYQLG
jgi:hypothetical protein